MIIGKQEFPNTLIKEVYTIYKIRQMVKEGTRMLSVTLQINLTLIITKMIMITKILCQNLHFLAWSTNATAAVNLGINRPNTA